MTAHRQISVIQGGARPALQQAVWEQSLAAVSGGIDSIPCGEGEGTGAPATKTRPTCIVTKVGGQTCQNGNVNEILDTRYDVSLTR